MSTSVIEQPVTAPAPPPARAAAMGPAMTRPRPGMARLVPIARKERLRGWGKLKKVAAAVDVAFTPEMDAEIAHMLERRS